MTDFFEISSPEKRLSIYSFATSVSRMEYMSIFHGFPKKEKSIQKYVSLTMKNVGLEGVHKLLQLYPDEVHTIKSKLCERAARGGHMNVLQWARSEGCPWNKSTCARAAKGGHLDVLQWLRVNGCPWNKKTCELAAKSGHLHVLRWARINGCPWDEWVCANAAGGGHLDVLQ